MKDDGGWAGLWSPEYKRRFSRGLLWGGLLTVGMFLGVTVVSIFFWVVWQKLMSGQ